MMKQLKSNEIRSVSGGIDSAIIAGTTLAMIAAPFAYSFGFTFADHYMDGERTAAENELTYLKSQNAHKQKQIQTLASNLKPSSPVAVTQIK